ncbi:MAG: hypothetical protein KDA87_00395, partial [Planctomycetales bacterium]|nr:hypothetical protein [Planctomycetales bacterium]
ERLLFDTTTPELSKSFWGYYASEYQFIEKANFVSNHRLARSVRTAALAANGVCIAGGFVGERPLLLLMVSV